MKWGKKQETETTEKKTFKEGMKSMFFKTVRVVEEDENGNEIIVDKEKLDVKKVALGVVGAVTFVVGVVTIAGKKNEDENLIEGEASEVYTDPWEDETDNEKETEEE